MGFIHGKVGLRLARQAKIGARKIATPSARKALFKSYHKLNEGKIHLEKISMKNNHTDITVRVPFGDMGVKDVISQSKKFFPLDKISKLPWDHVGDAGRAIVKAENKVLHHNLM